MDRMYSCPMSNAPKRFTVYFIAFPILISPFMCALCQMLALLLIFNQNKPSFEPCRCK